MSKETGSQDYDGNIIAIIDGDVTLSPATTIVTAGQCVEDETIIDFITKRARIEDFVGIEALTLCAEKSFRNLFDAYVKKYGKTLAETIIEGRLQITFLLNTLGGKAFTSRIINKAVQHVKTRGGQTNVYVTKNAMSAGAEIFEKGQSRFVLPESELMWHLSYMANNPGGERIGVEEDDSYCKSKEQQMERIKAFFRSTVHPEKIQEVLSRIQWAIDDQTNQDNDIYFTGAELHKYGLVKTVFPDAQAMKRHFTETTGFSTDKTEQFFFDQTIKEIISLGEKLIKNLKKAED